MRRGQWGFGHLRIRIFEKLVTLEITKNSLYKGIFSTFFVILCATMLFHAIKSSIFTKMGEFLLNHLNFAKFRHLRRQNGSLKPIFAIVRRLRRQKIDHFRTKLAPLAPLNSSPDPYALLLNHFPF